LTPADHYALKSRWVDPEMARRAGLRRVDSLTGGCDYSGILIPYFLPGSDQVRDYRLRRDLISAVARIFQPGRKPIAA
jgi:hypothetical protein